SELGLAQPEAEVAIIAGDLALADPAAGIDTGVDTAVLGEDDVHGREAFPDSGLAAAAGAAHLQVGVAAAPGGFGGTGGQDQRHHQQGGKQSDVHAASLAQPGPESSLLDPGQQQGSAAA